MNPHSEINIRRKELKIKLNNLSMASSDSTSIGADQSFDASVDWEDDVFLSMLKLADERRFQGMHQRVGDKLIHHSRCKDLFSDSWSNDPIGE